MPKYRFEITFDADSDEEAKEQVYGDAETGEGGAVGEFYSIHDDDLTHDDGSPVA